MNLMSTHSTSTKVKFYFLIKMYIIGEEICFYILYPKEIFQYVKSNTPYVVIRGGGMVFGAGKEKELKL